MLALRLKRLEQSRKPASSFPRKSSSRTATNFMYRVPGGEFESGIILMPTRFSPSASWSLTPLCRSVVVCLVSDVRLKDKKSELKSYKHSPEAKPLLPFSPYFFYTICTQPGPRPRLSRA
jgi:hypothetical protein